MGSEMCIRDSDNNVIFKLTYFFRGADAAVAGNRRCHNVFDAQGGVGLVSSIAVNVVEVHQRNLPLSGLLFLSPNDGSAALPWSLVPTAVVRF